MVAAVATPAASRRPLTVVPLELRARAQWVVWKREPAPTVEDPGKTTKVPKIAEPKGQLRNAMTACANKQHIGQECTCAQSTWRSFDVAMQAFTVRTDVDGVGYVLSADDPYTGVDLDHCRDPLTGEIAAAALAALYAFASYAEISPSGDGVHVWIRGKIADGDGHKRGGFEAYSARHFLTVTGQRTTATPGTIADAQPALDAYCAEHFSPKKTTNSSSPPPSRPPYSASDTELLTRARNHPKSGARFCTLFDRSDLTDYGGDHSAGDLALCNEFAYWCGPDSAERIDTLFRQSALIREKWDKRADYRAWTIGKALDGRTEFYAWPDAQSPTGDRRLAAELAAVKAELARTRAELQRAEARAVVAERTVRHLRREQVAEDRIMRQEETNDGDKVALMAYRRWMDRKSNLEKREPGGSLLVCYGGTDEETGRAYGLGALIGRSPEVAGDRVRRLAGMGAWQVETHHNWNGQFGVSRVAMRETYIGTMRPWTIVPTDATQRGKQGGKRIHVCQNPACRSPQLELVCGSCGTHQDGPPVYVDEAVVQQAGTTAPARNSIPAGQFDPLGETGAHVAPVCHPEPYAETGNVTPMDCLDDRCTVCGGELECYDAAGQPLCAAHAPVQREAG
jgi:putative DNA primase/helicase